MLNLLKFVVIVLAAVCRLPFDLIIDKMAWATGQAIARQPDKPTKPKIRQKRVKISRIRRIGRLAISAVKRMLSRPEKK